jgi:DNA-binding transcriptional MerR regulator
MSELAALTDVRPAAIKFYIKEGLLPAPVKTSRNMAYYDESFVEKIRLIKQLQSQHYLPLRVIKDLLARTGGSATLDETRALMDLKGSLAASLPAATREPLTEDEVIRRLNTYEEELESLRRMGLVNPREVNGTRIYDGEDQEFLELLENNRRLGFKGEFGFQVKDLELYLAILEILATEEVKLLVSRTATKLSTEEIRRLAERGIRDFGPLLMFLRRKMILKVLRSLPAGGADPGPGNGHTNGQGGSAPPDPGSGAS